MGGMNFASMQGYAIILFIKMILGAALFFLAILAWRKTSEKYMLYFILAVFFRYAEILYKTLGFLGFLTGEVLVIGGFPIGLMFFENASLVFFIIAFSLFIKSKNF